LFNCFIVLHMNLSNIITSNRHSDQCKLHASLNTAITISYKVQPVANSGVVFDLSTQACLIG